MSRLTRDKRWRPTYSCSLCAVLHSKLAMFPFPVELWKTVEEQGILGIGDYCSLVRVNKVLHDAFTPTIYANIHLNFKGALKDMDNPMIISNSSSKFAIVQGSLGALLERLDSASDLHEFIHTCTINNLCYDNGLGASIPTGYSILVEATMHLIGAFPNLHRLNLHESWVHIDTILWIASRPYLRLSIRVRSPFTHDPRLQGGVYGSPSLKTSFTARSLELSGTLGALDRLALSNSIEELHALNTSLETFHSVHKSLGSPVLAHLRSLKVKLITDQSLQVFDALPNLTELWINSSASQVQALSPPNNWHASLTRLHTFLGPYSFVRAFTNGRSITSLGISHPCVFTQYSRMGNQFGSKVPITTLRLSKCTSPEDLILYILEFNSRAVRDLRFQGYIYTPCIRVRILSIDINITHQCQ